MTTRYDAIVLGGGSTGEHCVGALADRGLRVALVERDLVGGECSYWACIPSKTLLRPGEAVGRARDATATAQVDPDAALAWRDFMVSNYSDAAQERWLNDKDIDLLRGDGRIIATGTIEVDGTHFAAEHLIVATGSEPVMPAIPGLAELPGVWTTHDATSMKQIPRRLVVLGGGPAGIELAQATRRLGAEVVIVTRAGQLLPAEPAPLGQAVGEALRRDGINLLVDANATSARLDDDEYVVSVDGHDDVRGERLLVATGRRPRLRGYGLETLGIDVTGPAIPVDNRLRAGERLWAIGDVTGMWLFTHVGKYQGEIVAANILGEPREAHYDAVPRVTYTDPQAAGVGATTARFEVTVPIQAEARMGTYSRGYADSNGFLTLLSDGVTLTGAYALAPEAGEWLQQATLAIRAGIPLDVLRDTIQPFPTFSELFVAALKALDNLITAESATGPDHQRHPMHVAASG